MKVHPECIVIIQVVGQSRCIFGWFSARLQFLLQKHNNLPLRLTQKRVFWGQVVCEHKDRISVLWQVSIATSWEHRKHWIL